MALYENTFNLIFGRRLRSRFHTWSDGRVVRIEDTGQLTSGKGKRPDVVVVPSGGYPVVFEGAYADTSDVDKDARARIGVILEEPRLEVMTGFVIVIPPSWREYDDVAAEAAMQNPELEFEYAVFTKGQGKELERFPSGGYARGTVAQLADLASICSVPGHLIDERITAIYEKIEDIAARMEAGLGPGPRDRLVKALGVATSDAALRVCVCIWLDAFLAQERLAETEEKFAGCSSYQGIKNAQLKNKVSKEWKVILRKNYVPIFTPARETLNVLAGRVGVYLRKILDVADDVVDGSLHHILDIGGELLPRLASDRRETAAFYTLRESADLLTGLVPESCYKDLAARKGDHPGLVGDFACGTGSLLVSAYRRIRREIDAAGGEPDKHHRWWMEDGLFGVDIQPIAVHLTSTRLSSFAMNQKYKNANIIYAGLDGGKTGALELLDRPKLLDLFPVEVGKNVEDLHAPAPDDRFGLCVMNPPYTVSGGKHGAFRVSQLKDGETLKSQKNYGEQIKGTFAHAKAGMASSFAALADKKLRDGGVYASVLPATAAASSTWTNFRKYLWNHYNDITVVSTANDEHQSFSADTGMEELLVVATKRKTNKKILHFICLYVFPKHTVETETLVNVIRAAIKKSVPGEPSTLYIGDKAIGSHIAYETAEDEPWTATCVRDLSLIGFMGRFHCYADMQALSDVFNMGYAHPSVGHLEGKKIYGVFVFRPVSRGVTPLYPSLWANDHETQRTILTKPTHEGEPAHGQNDLRRRVLDRRTQFFWGQNLRLTSQAMSIAFTSSPCLNGRAWAGLLSQQQGVDKALCLWANSIFGLAWRWIYGGKQQKGRSQILIEAAKALCIPRFEDHALHVAATHFDELIRLPLRPCAYAQWDDNRRQIDAVVREMFGFGDDLDEDVEQLRLRWCREPGVHGGKSEIVDLLRADGML